MSLTKEEWRVFLHTLVGGKRAHDALEHNCHMEEYVVDICPYHVWRVDLKNTKHIWLTIITSFTTLTGQGKTMEGGERWKEKGHDKIFKEEYLMGSCMHACVRAWTCTDMHTCTYRPGNSLWHINIQILHQQYSCDYKYGEPFVHTAICVINTLNYCYTHSIRYLCFLFVWYTNVEWNKCTHVCSQHPWPHRSGGEYGDC